MTQPGWPPRPVPQSPRKGVIIAFSAAIVTIVVVLIVFVAVVASKTSSSLSTRRSVPSVPTGGNDSAQPRANRDHWHVAYGVYLCDHFIPPLSDVGSDRLGIHTHTDGVIHVHPFTATAAGSNARLGVFADQVGMTIAKDRIVLPDGTTKRNGDDCNGKPGTWTVREWIVDQPDARPRTVTSDLADVRFDGDRTAMTIAFVPEGTDIPQPESIPYLDQLTDVPPTSPRRPGTTRSGTGTSTTR